MTWWQIEGCDLYKGFCKEKIPPKVAIYLRRKSWNCHIEIICSCMLPIYIYEGFKMFLFFSPACSQIWLSPLVSDHPSTFSNKLSWSIFWTLCSTIERRLPKLVKALHIASPHEDNKHGKRKIQSPPSYCRATPMVLNMWPWKENWIKKSQNMLVWLSKMVLAQHFFAEDAKVGTTRQSTTWHLLLVG